MATIHVLRIAANDNDRGFRDDVCYGPLGDGRYCQATARALAFAEKARQLAARTFAV